MGYTPNLQRILSSSILKTLEYDPEDTFGPLSLAWDVLYAGEKHVLLKRPSNCKC